MASLTSQVVLVEGQHGVVGETGTVTTVQPDGAFTVSDFVRDRVEPPRRTGRLTPEALSELSRSLDASLGHGLPARVATATGANPQRVRIQYGGADVTLLAPPDEDLDAPAAPQLAAGDAPGARVLRARQALRRLVPSE